MYQLYLSSGVFYKILKKNGKAVSKRRQDSSAELSFREFIEAATGEPYPVPYGQWTEGATVIPVLNTDTMLSISLVWHNPWWECLDRTVYFPERDFFGFLDKFFES